MGLIRALTTKPWLNEPAGIASLPAGRKLPAPTASLGLYLFLTVVTVLFLLLSVTYLTRMAFQDWQPLREPWLLWPNSALLLLGSIALAARRDDPRAAAYGLLAADFLGCAFLAGQLAAWSGMIALGYFAAGNPANAFFYLLTALHGLHLLGGLVLLGRVTLGLWRPDADLDRWRRPIGLLATYWHFLLAVWLVLFALLLADNGGKDALAGIVAFCRGLIQ